jgi:phosphate-selective porin OprO/OprP
MFRIVLVAVVVTAATPLFAQSMPAGFDSGFFLQSPDGNTRVVLGLVAQTDGRFALDDTVPITDTFTARKVRPTLSGRLAKYLDFKVTPDFGNGTAVLQDAYFDTRFSTAFRIRIGKDKTPIGYEILVTDANLWFPERSLASSLLPNRDVGVQAQGDLAGGRVAYAAGLFNGVTDAGSSTADVDTNSAKDFGARLLVQPFRRAEHPGPLNGLGIHVGGSIGDQAGAVPSFRTSVGQTYFTYSAGAAADGRRTRVTPAAFFFYKAFGTFGEYVRSTQTIARAGTTREVQNHAVEITASYFLTGETAGTGTIRPRRVFDPATGRWGAVQLLTRYSRLDIDDAAFVSTLAAPGASRRADQWAAALNWYPNQFIKWYASYERTVFDRAAAGVRPVEHAILFRAQVAF